MSNNKSEFHEVLCGLKINDLKCGFSHTLALTSSGEVYAWGRNECGQIGDGLYDHQMTPTKLNGFHNEKVVMISCGRSHSMASL
jgi:alpha-tubulin suppressor-like RCC1 family protein